MRIRLIMSRLLKSKLMRLTLIGRRLMNISVHDSADLKDNAYAQTGLMVYFYSAAKKNKINHLHNK